MQRALTRVAVVQLAYHPAIVVERRSPLEDPLYRAGVPDPLLPESGTVPEPLKPRLDALRRRIRELYIGQLLKRVSAILGACRAFNVHVVVLPEYSVPWEILPDLADAAGAMVVVAGSHTVDRAARRSGVYEKLGLSTGSLPAMGQSVCPVLHRGRLLALQPKLNPGSGEQGSMRSGETWTPVAMPDGVPGPLGVLLGPDFLLRDNGRHQTLVAEPMAACPLLAVPSLTPHYSLPELSGRSIRDEARRAGRPVLYANGSEEGGSSILLPGDVKLRDLRSFPEHAGYLEPDDEGAVIADVSLGDERGSGRTAGGRALVPVAEATLVYRTHPVAEAYAQWLEAMAPLFARDDDEALDAIVFRMEGGARDLLLNAGALPGAQARDRRLKRLLGELDRVTSVEEIRQFTREIVLPPDVLPFWALSAALARGAADEVFDWLKLKEARSAGFGEVEALLRGEAEKIIADASSWTRAGMETLGTLAQSVRWTPDPDAKGPPSEARVRVVLPAWIDPAVLGTRRQAGFLFDFRSRPDDFSSAAREGSQPPAARDRSSPRGRGKAARESASPLDYSEAHLSVAEELYLLAVAEGAERVGVIGVRPEKSHAQSGRTFDNPVLLILSSQGERWVVREAGRSPWLETKWNEVSAGLAEAGLGEVALDSIPDDQYRERITAQLDRFAGARAMVSSFRKQRLREVSGQFVEPSVMDEAAHAERPILDALDAWLASDEQTALVLGKLGSGKSTSLAVWAQMRWEARSGPRPILANLAGAPRRMDAETLLLEAAELPDTRSSRAALRLLIRRRLLIPCFDGFDEIAPRLDVADLAGRLSSLVDVARGGGKVIVTSHDKGSGEGEPSRSSIEIAIAQALASSAGLRRLVVQPFDDEHVKSLVTQIAESRRGQGGSPRAAEDTLARIAQTYDLRDLVSKPLELGMVLATIDRIEPGSKIGVADLYEAYLARWLDETRSGDPQCFTDTQKVELAESLADQLWRSGRAACTWKELSQSVRARLAEHLPIDTPPPAALQELQRGAFFLCEPDDRYRFAHTSFLEYFVARAIVHTVALRPKDVLDTMPITPEVAIFVGEILRRQGDPKASAAVRRMQGWLAGQVLEAWSPEGREVVSARAEALQSTALAAANAVRLLLQLGRWAKEAGGFIPEGADLRGVRMIGEDLRGASLVRAHLEEAHLSGADLSGANLTGARLDRARLNGARLDGAIFAGASLRGTDFTQSEAHGANLKGADFTDAVLRAFVTLNPFRPGPALTDADTLPGREPVINNLLALLESRSPAVLRGPRRSGKTSLLHHIARRLASPARRVRRITLEGSQIRTADDLAVLLEPSLKTDPAPAESFRAMLREERSSVLLLDEMANLKDADLSVFAWLRAIGQEEASVLYAGSFWDFVLVIERAAAAHGSPFGNDVTPVNLGSIPEADAVRFLVENAPHDVPMKEDLTARWIIELCGPWPFYLQVMGHAVVQAVRAGDRLALVERRGVSDLYEQRLLLDRDPVFRGRWAELPERARRILRPASGSASATPVKDLPAYKDLARDDKKVLRDTGLCNPLGQWLEDRPFFEWIRRSADDDEGESHGWAPSA